MDFRKSIVDEHVLFVLVDKNAGKGTFNKNFVFLFRFPQRLFHLFALAFESLLFKGIFHRI